MDSEPSIGSIWKYIGKGADSIDSQWVTFQVLSESYLKADTKDIIIVDIKIIEDTHWNNWHLKALNIDHWINPTKCSGMKSLEQIDMYPVKPRSRFELIDV